MNPHEGHRDRLKRSFLKNGLDTFDDHVVLELLLCYALPRGDVNPIAHELLSRFGSVAGVFDAKYEELTEVKGIGDNAATLIKLIPQLARRYQISRADKGDMLDSVDKTGEYLMARYLGERDEVVYLLCCDAKRKLISCREIARGEVNSANVSIRKLVETALAANATSVIISHNHTSGIALPSREDKITTRRIRDALWAVGIELTDHIIVGENDFVSMSDSGMLLREDETDYE